MVVYLMHAETEFFRNENWRHQIKFETSTISIFNLQDKINSWKRFLLNIGFLCICHVFTMSTRDYSNSTMTFYSKTEDFT